MTDYKPLVSIIVPCYNQAHFLEDTLNSIMQQSYENWECILVNDGSTDNTDEIAEKWYKSDNRFHYIKKENGGSSSARGAGLKIANGNYYIFLDSDDLLHKNKIKDSINEIRTSKANLVISDFLMFEDNIKNLKPAFCNLSEQNFSKKTIVLDWDKKFAMPPHTGFFSKELFNNIKFRTFLKDKEDWLMWVEVFQNDPKVAFINKPLVYYRINPQGKTKDRSLRRIKNSNQTRLEIAKVIKDEEIKNTFLLQILNSSSEKTYITKKKVRKYKNISKILGLTLVITLISLSLFYLLN